MKRWNFPRTISSLSLPNFNRPSPLQLNRLLQLCSKSKLLTQGKQVHQQIISNGFDQHPFMITKLIQMYADCENLSSANHLFDELPQPNVFAWTAVLDFYSRNGLPYDCILTYGDMRMKGFSPDKYVFPKIIRSCAQLVWLEIGIRVHKEVIFFGCEINLHVCNSMIDMYSKCGDITSSRRVFDQMVERDLLSWNSMISGYVSNGVLSMAIEMFDFMRLNCVELDLITLNTVMDAYCRMELCEEASKIFEQINEPNLISWTILISGYSRIGEDKTSLKLFKEMMIRGVKPDLDSLSSILVSCRNLGALRNGREIHGYGMKINTISTFYKSTGPALLTMYSKCKRICIAKNVFGLMDKYDVVTWNAMILGFIDSGLEQLALECFTEMQKTGIKNDQTTIATILPICDLKLGKEIHTHMKKHSLDQNTATQNALIHMYSKCGCIETAHHVFSNMPNKDIVSWNTIISGFGMNGHGESAIQFLQKMKNSGIDPNHVTFTATLSACSHAGLVNDGLELFHNLDKDFKVNPGMEHYACIVDLLARAGRLNDAVKFVNAMPIKADKFIWGTLLASSLEHHNVIVGKLAAKKLLVLEPEHAGHYVTLSKMYAKDGKWDDAMEVRRLMEDKGLMKLKGCSLIESQN